MSDRITRGVPTSPSIPVRGAFLYLVAIMDWASRRVLSWRLSNTMDTEFCLEALTDPLERFGGAEIFNTDSKCLGTN